MALNNANPSLMQYFQRQQTPDGWFTLLTIMIDGMVKNAGEQESRPFLIQMGRELAQAFPLRPCATVGELEDQVNAYLAHFNWGQIEIDARDNALLLRHQALPVAQQESFQHQWCNAFCAIIEGLYAVWLQEQGGKDNVSLWRDNFYSPSDVQFRYQVRNQ